MQEQKSPRTLVKIPGDTIFDRTLQQSFKLFSVLKWVGWDYQCLHCAHTKLLQRSVEHVSVWAAGYIWGSNMYLDACRVYRYVTVCGSYAKENVRAGLSSDQHTALNV